MRNKLAIAALLAFLALPLFAQTIRPTRVSQLRLTQLTTAQEGTMTLVEGDVWYNTDLNCTRLRLSASSVCILEGGGTSDAIIKTPTADQRIAGNFNLFAAKIHNIRFVDPSGQFTTIQLALDDAGAEIILVPATYAGAEETSIADGQSIFDLRDGMLEVRALRTTTGAGEALILVQEGTNLTTTNPAANVRVGIYSAVEATESLNAFGMNPLVQVASGVSASINAIEADVNNK